MFQRAPAPQLLPPQHGVPTQSYGGMPQTGPIYPTMTPQQQQFFLQQQYMLYHQQPQGMVTIQSQMIQQQPTGQQQMAQLRPISATTPTQQGQPVNQFPQVNAIPSIVNQPQIPQGYFQSQPPVERQPPPQAIAPRTRSKAIQIIDPNTQAPIDLTSKLPEASKSSSQPSKKPEESAPEVCHPFCGFLYLTIITKWNSS